MARMHSRKRGKSGSKKPKNASIEWVKYSKEEIKELILKLGRKGVSSSKIGLILRDKYGIPDVKTIIGEKIFEVLKKEKIYKEPEDLKNLENKAKKIEQHLERNKKDFHSKRSLELTKAKIRRLKKYYKRKGRV